MRRERGVPCKLERSQVGFRRAEWHDIRQQLEIVERTRRPDAFRITFRGPKRAIEVVQRLVASERECCSWADWQLHEGGEAAALEVTAREELLEPLARAFGFMAIEPAAHDDSGHP
jgi:hypothetical protein